MHKQMIAELKKNLEDLKLERSKHVAALNEINEIAASLNINIDVDEMRQTRRTRGKNKSKSENGRGRRGRRGRKSRKIQSQTVSDKDRLFKVISRSMQDGTNTVPVSLVAGRWAKGRNEMEAFHYTLMRLVKGRRITVSDDVITLK